MGGIVAILIAMSLQNMSITQRPLWIDDINVMSNDKEKDSLVPMLLVLINRTSYLPL